MGRAFGFAVMAGLIFIGATIYVDGPRNAFGGAFSFLAAGDDMPERASEYVSTPQRIGARVESSIQSGADRYEGVMED